jgi:hypothetical protein
MKRREAELAMKAAKKAGITVFRVASMVNKGEVILMRKYNKSGDSLCFNPYSSICDAMLLAMKAMLSVDFGDMSFSVETKEKDVDVSKISISLKGLHRNSDEYRIGNAIVNIINQ